MLLVAQIVNFFIIGVVLNVLLFKPILSMLEKRKKEIAEGLVYTEKMREEKDALEQKKEKILMEARKEGDRIIEEAKKGAKAEEKVLLEQARKASDDIIVKGKAMVEQEREAMEKTMKKDSVTLGIHVAERILMESVSSDIAHKIMAKHIKNIQHV